MILLKYAMLNLGRKKKQTLFSLLCIFVSSFIILTDSALINGMEERLKEAINRVMSGQVTVYSSVNDKINILEAQLTEQDPFDWSASDGDAFGKQFPEFRVNQRIRIGSLISFGDETSYLHFHALEDSHLEKINTMLTFRQGRMPVTEDGIIISTSLAKDLDCTTGDTVLLVANNLFDYMSDAIGVVSGIFEEKGIAIYLSHNGFMPLKAGKILAGAGDEESLELVINPGEERDLSGKEIKAIRQWFNANHPGLRLTRWNETAPLLYSIAKVWQGGGVIMQGMFTVFSLVILITLTSLVVRSRKKEFGTLLAIGFSWLRIKLLVCGEYALLCTASVLLGFGLLQGMLAFTRTDGIVLPSEDMQYALMTDKLFPFLLPENLLHVWVLFLATTLVSTLISIRRLQKRNIQSLINK